jgi:hypothetical protein
MTIVVALISVLTLYFVGNMEGSVTRIECKDITLGKGLSNGVAEVKECGKYICRFLLLFAYMGGGGRGGIMIVLIL